MGTTADPNSQIPNISKTFTTITATGTVNVPDTCFSVFKLCANNPIVGSGANPGITFSGNGQGFLLAKTGSVCGGKYNTSGPGRNGCAAVCSNAPLRLYKTGATFVGGGGEGGAAGTASAGTAGTGSTHSPGTRGSSGKASVNTNCVVSPYSTDNAAWPPISVPLYPLLSSINGSVANINRNLTNGTPGYVNKVHKNTGTEITQSSPDWNNADYVNQVSGTDGTPGNPGQSGGSGNRGYAGNGNSGSTGQNLVYGPTPSYDAAFRAATNMYWESQGTYNLAWQTNNNYGPRVNLCTDAGRWRWIGAINVSASFIPYNAISAIGGAFDNYLWIHGAGALSGPVGGTNRTPNGQYKLIAGPLARGTGPINYTGKVTTVQGFTINPANSGNSGNYNNGNAGGAAGNETSGNILSS